MTRRPDMYVLLPGVLLAAVSAVLLLVGTPFANATFTAKVTNSKNSVATAVDATCAGTARIDGAYFVYPFDDKSSSTAADVSGNDRTGTYQNTSGLGYRKAGPCGNDNGKSIKLDGSSSYVTGVQAATASPTTFSEEIWFRVKKADAGGRLIGLGIAPTGSSSQYDRHIFMSDAGNLVFGVYPGTVKTIVSPGTYNDNTWHQAVASLAPSGSYAGMRLYVDGTLVASDPDTRTAQTYDSSTSYWRMGYGNLSNWGPLQPSDFYFAGWLAYASVYTTALSPNQVLAHYDAGSS